MKFDNHIYSIIKSEQEYLRLNEIDWSKSKGSVDLHFKAGFSCAMAHDAHFILAGVVKWSETSTERECHDYLRKAVLMEARQKVLRFVLMQFARGNEYVMLQIHRKECNEIRVPIIGEQIGFPQSEDSFLVQSYFGNRQRRDRLRQLCENVIRLKVFGENTSVPLFWRIDVVLTPNQLDFRVGEVEVGSAEYIFVCEEVPDSPEQAVDSELSSEVEGSWDLDYLSVLEEVENHSRFRKRVGSQEDSTNEWMIARVCTQIVTTIRRLYGVSQTVLNAAEEIAQTLRATDGSGNRNELCADGGRVSSCVLSQEICTLVLEGDGIHLQLQQKKLEGDGINLHPQQQKPKWIVVTACAEEKENEEGDAQDDVEEPWFSLADSFLHLSQYQRD